MRRAGKRGCFIADGEGGDEELVAVADQQEGA